MSSLILHSKTKLIADALAANPNGVIGVYGEPGSGKPTVARYIAAKICNTTNIESYPHLTIVYGNDVGIAEIRELQQKLSLSVPAIQGYDKRVVIIENCDNLSVEAQNALLKTIEEPPVNTLIFLCIERESNILATIQSRIQKLPILPVSLSAIERAFPDVTKDIIKRNYALSGGHVGLFVSLVNNQADHPLILAINKAKEFMSLSKPLRLIAIDSFLKSKDITPPELVDGYIRINQAMLVAALDNRQSLLDERIGKLTQQLQQSIKTFEYLSQGGNPKLHLSRLMIS